MELKERLAALRQKMKEEGVDTVVVTKFDPHQSEYSPAFWNGVQFLSGFSGSAGVLVVTTDTARLFTDGRYAIQAPREVAGNGITVESGGAGAVQDEMAYAAAHTPEKGCIAFDGRTLSVRQVRALQAKVLGKAVTFKDIDFLEGLWTDRPAISMSPVYDFAVDYCGCSRQEKLKLVREKMAEEGVCAYVISSTDDIAWLLNLRGNDMDHSTCFASFAVIEKEAATLFVHDEKAKDVVELLAADGVSVRPYGDITPYLQNLKEETPAHALCAFNPSTTAYSVFVGMEGMAAKELAIDWTTHMKAVKNETELENLDKALVADGIAMVRFIKWVKEAVKEKAVSEVDVADMLLSLRARNEDFVFPCFTTIAAYMDNAAMMHYAPKKENCATLKPEGFLLVDSGGQYLRGTTDITRTIALGPLTPQMVEDFTLVLQSHIALADTVFLYGATGPSLDVIARGVMWEKGLDYKCGTGHGIGFFLNVHEGPHTIRMAPTGVRLEAGMVMSNEPGIYRQDAYGIRTENLMTVVPHRTTAFGEFMAFQTLTYCPIDLEAVDVSLLSEKARAWLNNYHQLVYDKLAPGLDEDERAWLADATRLI